MKTEKKRSLKGAVLFTVVSVLALLIIMMTCTLAMAAAANKRARKTYSTSQSSYTARTAIDSILAAVGTDKNFSKSIRDLTNIGDSMDVIVELNNASMGSINNAKITYKGTKKVFDPDEKVMSWVERNLYEISADITIGGETTTIKSNVLQDPPQPPPGNGNGAAFLTYGDGLDVANHAGLFGGSYIGMGEWEESAGGTLISNWQSSLIYNEWNPVIGKMVVLADKGYQSGKTYNVQNQSVMSAPAVVNGNLKMANSKIAYIYNYRGSGINNPGIQIWGDFTSSDGGVVSLDMADHVKKDIKANGYKFMDMPYMFVDGTISGENLTIGNDGLPLNVFCDRLVNRKNGLKVYADVYCMDREGISGIATSSSNLHKWSSSVINGGVSYSTMGGNFYSKGSLDIKAETKFEGDVRIEGDLILTSGQQLTVDGNLVVGGRIIIDEPSNLDVKGTIYADTNKIGLTVADPAVAEQYEQKEIKQYKVAFNIDHTHWIENKTGMYIYADQLDAVGKALGETLNKNATEFPPKNISEAKWKSIESYCKPDWDHPARYQYAEKDHPENVISVEEYNKKLNTGFNKTDIGKPVIAVSLFTEDIYPSRAEKETLMGVHWPIKGIENRVTTLSDDDEEIKNKIDGTKYNQFNVPAIITDSCTLNGEFSKEVKIKSSEGKDVYVLLENVDFNCTNTELNNSFISVDESAGGKVYFVLKGNVVSNYNYTVDDTDKKLIKTVYDWMNEFALENNKKEPPATCVEVNANDSNFDEVLKNAITSAASAGHNHVKINGNANFTKDVHITPLSQESSELWITLNGVKFDKLDTPNIIVDDMKDGKRYGGKVNFYIEGVCEFRGPGGILTQSFIDIQSEDKIYIFGNNALKDTIPEYKNLSDAEKEKKTYTAPRVYIYGAKNSKIKGENFAYFTAYVHAIDTVYDVPDGFDNETLVKKIVYDGYSLSRMLTLDGLSGMKRIACIGMLDAKGAYFTNDNLSLYVDESDSEQQFVVDAEGKHTYSSVEYMAYAN